MQTSKLFTLLPEELVCTPDGMAIDRDGNLILSCPNFADLSMPSCVLKIDKDRNIKKWFDVPRNEYTGEARAMGIEFGPDGDLYLVDNAGWTGEPHMVFTGRILRLRLNDAGVVKCTVVADNMEHPNGIRIWGDYMYITQSCMTRQKTDSGKLMSCVYRFPLDLAAPIAVAAVRSALRPDTTLEEITFVCFDGRTRAAYDRALAGPAV